MLRALFHGVYSTRGDSRSKIVHLDHTTWTTPRGIGRAPQGVVGTLSNMSKSLSALIWIECELNVDTVSGGIPPMSGNTNIDDTSEHVLENNAVVIHGI